MTDDALGSLHQTKHPQTETKATQNHDNMTGNARRPPLPMGINRTASFASRCNALETINVDQPTVINSTALSRSLSCNSNVGKMTPHDRITMDTSPSPSDDKISYSKFSHKPDSSTLPLTTKDSLARDPFVSISRAIHSAKLRAGASLRTMSNHKQYNHRAARYRAVYRATKKVSRLFSAVLFVLIFIFLFSQRHRTTDNHKDEQTNSSFWQSFFQPASSHSLSNTSIHSDRHDHNQPSRSTNSLLEGDTRHRPPAYTPPTFHTGPWLIALVADLDTDSCRQRDPATGSLRTTTSCTGANAWVSYFKRGILSIPPTARKKLESNATTSALSWLDERELDSIRQIRNPSTGFRALRGMELSELEWFNGHLLTPDDRGVLLEIISPRGLLDDRASHLLPSTASNVPPSVSYRAFLADGDGQTEDQGFKAEWMVVKDDKLVVGGHGRPFTDIADGTIVQGHGSEWVKVFNADMNITHDDWTAKYQAVAKQAGVQFPGYLMHEAVLWSSLRREWIFLPRRRSEQAFSEEGNERKGWNGVVIANEDFTRFNSVLIEGLKDESGLNGFSTARFVPGSAERLVVALRTVELEKNVSNALGKVRETASYLSVFDVLTGVVVLEEHKVSDMKYEGLVFL